MSSFTCPLVSAIALVEGAVEDAGTEDAVFSLEGSWNQLLATLRGIWAQTIAQVPTIVMGILVILVTWGVARIATKYLERYLDHRDMRRSLRDLTLRFAILSIWVFGLMLAAMLMFPGLTPTKALGVLGLGSVAIGFAFKDLFENFLAGIMILWRFPFEIGDYIECEGIMGKVDEITIRNTLIRRPTDELVIVPNATLFKNPVNVLTEHAKRRVTVMSGVAYDVDVPRALDLIERALDGCSTVDREKAPQVFAHGFGASSIDIEVAYWTDSTPLGERRSRSEVVQAIKRALDDNEIEIPFPYRTLTFKEPLPVQQSSDGIDR